MTAIKRATLSAILLISLLSAACTPSSQAGSRTSAFSSNAPADVTPTPGRTTLTIPGPADRPLEPAPVHPSLARNHCPPITANPVSANPVGCPGPWPPQPITPQAGHARIMFCTPPVAAPPLPVGTVVCGAGFRPEELVTITVSGRAGSSSWQVGAGPDGSFRSTLLPVACRVMPASLTARGNHGSLSNTIPLTLVTCRRPS